MRVGHMCDSSLCPQLRPNIEQTLRKRMSEPRSLKTQTAETRDSPGTHVGGDPQLLWRLPPTASLQEPQGVQVALSAVVGHSLPTHRSGWDGEGLDLPLELVVTGQRLIFNCK